MGQSARWYLDVTDDIFNGIGELTNSTINQFIEDTGGLEGQDIAFVQYALGFAPEPITPKQFIKRSPYTNPESYKRQMDEAVERGWLQAVGEDQYQLTAKGKDVAKGIFALADDVFGGIESLPDTDLKRLVELLLKVVKKAKKLPEPAKKASLASVLKFDRGPSAPLMVQVRRRLIDLRAYRDDVHIAAWQPYDVSGQAWEALTFVWRDKANTAAELAEKLPFRNYDKDAYAAVLEDLVARGWIAKENGRYVATKKGKSLRQEAEDATDRYFDAAWMALSEAETKEVKGLLKKLAKAVKPPEQESAES